MSRRVASSSDFADRGEDNPQKRKQSVEKRSNSVRRSSVRTAHGKASLQAEKSAKKSGKQQKLSGASRTNKQTIDGRKTGLQSDKKSVSTRKVTRSTIKTGSHQVNRPERKPRSVKGSPAPEHDLSARLNRSSVQSAHKTRSASGSFVDARALKSDDALFQPMSDTGKHNADILVKPKVVDFKARIREKQKATRRAIAIRWSVVVAAIVAIVGLVWTLCWSPILLLDEHDIQIAGGNQWVSDNQIMNIVKVHQGRSLLLISTAGIEDAINAQPGVTGAKVQKHFPHGMKIEFQAQEPAAVLKSSDGKFVAVDERGRVLHEIATAPQGLPLIEVSSFGRGVSDHAVQQALQVLAGLPTALREKITKVAAPTQDSVTTEIDNGNRVIVWGDSSDLDLKLAVVDKIINDPTKIADKHHVDVSAPLRPIIK